jgi:RND family efflux transporter MFP subunit
MPRLRCPMRVAVILAVAGVPGLLGGCLKEQAPEADAKPVATQVTVSQPARQEVRDFVEFTGHTEPFSSVDVRARVKGFLKTVNFADGAMVKEGDLLYEIEPDIFQAQADKAKATLQAAEARQAKAKADLDIKKEMAAGNAASKLDVILAEAQLATAVADIAGAKAMLEQADIDLGYTKIYAPLSGRIDKTRVTAGNLVGADGNTLLANIVNITPIYAYFDVDEATVQRFQARMRKDGGGSGATTTGSGLPVDLALGDTGDFKYHGVMDYIDNKVDTSTGTLTVRARLDNADRALAPGFFARVRVPDGEPYDAVLVPERSIGVDQGQKYVFVVNEKNAVESRPIEVGTQQGRLRVVQKGVAANDWVITDGLLRTRPGATVDPQKKPLAMAPGAAAAAPTTRPQS